MPWFHEKSLLSIIGHMSSQYNPSTEKQQIIENRPSCQENTACVTQNRLEIQISSTYTESVLAINCIWDIQGPPLWNYLQYIAFLREPPEAWWGWANCSKKFFFCSPAAWEAQDLCNSRRWLCTISKRYGIVIIDLNLSIIRFFIQQPYGLCSAIKSWEMQCCSSMYLILLYPWKKTSFSNPVTLSNI